MVGTTLGCFTSLMVCILGVCSSFCFFFCDVFQIFAFLSWASDTGFLYSLSSIPGSSPYPCCCLPSPPCLPWVTPSQLSDLSLSIVLLENLSSPTTPSLLPTPAFQRAVIAPTAPPASVAEYPSQLRFYLCPCHYSIHSFLSSSDCRLCERRKHICLCSPLYPPGLVQVTNRSLSLHLWDR